jgi:hypothetical protein
VDLEVPIDPGFVARALVRSVFDLGPWDVPAERHLPALAAIGSLSRCRSLLASMVLLREAGRSDAIGVLGRAVFEFAIYGSLVLLGTDEDRDRLNNDWRRWSNQLGRDLPVDELEPMEGPETWFPLKQRAIRLGVALQATRGESPDAPLKWYEWFYSAESLFSAHASGASISRYLVDGVGGVVGFNPDPPEADPDLASMVMAIQLTYALASYMCQEFGVSHRALDETAGLQALLTTGPAHKA